MIRRKPNLISNDLEDVKGLLEESADDLRDDITKIQTETGVVSALFERGGLNFQQDAPPTISSYNQNWRARTPIENPMWFPAGTLIIPNNGYRIACNYYDGEIYASSGWVASISGYTVKEHFEIPQDSTCWIIIGANSETGDAVPVKTLVQNVDFIVSGSHEQRIEYLEDVENKNPINQIANDAGIVYYDKWEMGGLNTTEGAETPTISSFGSTFRARTPITSPVIAKAGNYIIVEDGYQFLVSYNSGSGCVNTSWINDSFEIPADCSAWIMIRKAGEDQQPIPLKTLVKQVVIRMNSAYSLVNRITELEELPGQNKFIPDYYYENDYLPNKYEEVRTASRILNGIVFPFVTDLHLLNNSGYSKYMIRELFEKTSCSFALSGGDYQAGYGGASELTEQFNRYYEYIGVVGHDRWFPIVGNHDFYNMEHEGDPRDTWTRATWGRVYDAIIRPSERWQIDTQNGGYYCIDLPNQKTRIIMLNSSEQSPPASDTLFDGLIRTRPTQVQWLARKINEISDYHIIVVSHVPSDPNMTSYISAMDYIQQILEAFAQKTSAVIHFTNEWTWNVDFSNTTNELVCHINGHSHADESHVQNGVLSISTTCDACFRDDGHGAVRGTITEQGFDVFCVDYDKKTINAVRFGRGSNRNWSYT